MKTKKDVLSLWKIALGAVFLFNPTINIVDPLPDFIGYFLIASGLFAFSHISDRGAAARKYFIYLAAASIAKLLVCLILPSVMEDTFSTLMAFSFSVLEAVFFIAAFRNFFECISSLGVRYGSEGVFHIPHSRSEIRKIEALSKKVCGSEKEKARNEKKLKRLMEKKSMGSLEALTVTAFIVRAAGAILPTLPALSMVNVTYFPSEGDINWNDYIGPIYILAWIAGFSVGIPWLRRFRRYIKGISGEEELCEGAYETYRKNILSDPLCLTANRMKSVMRLSLVAVALTMYMPVDGVNIFPSVLSATFFIAALVLMYNWNKLMSVIGCVSAAAWGVLSVIGTYLQADYSAQYGSDKFSGELYGAVNFGVERAVEKFDNMLIYSYIEAGLFALTVIIFAIAFVKAVRSHIEMMPESVSSKEREPKRLMRCLVPVAVCAFLTVAANGALLFAMKYLTEAWLINAVLVIAFFCFSLRAYYRLDETVYETLRRKF